MAKSFAEVKANFARSQFEYWWIKHRLRARLWNRNTSATSSPPTDMLLPYQTRWDLSVSLRWRKSKACGDMNEFAENAPNKTNIRHSIVNKIALNKWLLPLMLMSFAQLFHRGKCDIVAIFIFASLPNSPSIYFLFCWFIDQVPPISIQIQFYHLIV